jgi:hypothetical protein
MHLCCYWMISCHVWKCTSGSFHNQVVPFISMEFLLILSLQCVVFRWEFFLFIYLSINCETIHFCTSCRLMQLLSRTLSVQWLSSKRNGHICLLCATEVNLKDVLLQLLREKSGETDMSYKNILVPLKKLHFP